MTPLRIAVALSVLSAIGYALGAVTQERLANRRKQSANSGNLLLSGQWWLTTGLNAAGAALHAVALRYGSLAIVQPFGTLTLVFALPIGAICTGRRVSGREWRGAAVTVLGLIGLLLVTDTRAPTRGLDDGQIVALVVVTAAVVGLFTQVGRSAPRTHGLLLATAGGIAFGVASVLTQTVLLRFTGPAAGAPLISSGLTAATVAVLAVTGLLLSQAAYRIGLGAPLATLTITNPVTAAFIGVVLLRQPLVLSLGGTVLAVIAAVVTAIGIGLLAVPAETPDPQAEPTGPPAAPAAAPATAARPTAAPPTTAPPPTAVPPTTVPPTTVPPAG